MDVMNPPKEGPLNFKIVNIKDENDNRNEGDSSAEESAWTGTGVGSSTPNIVMKEDESTPNDRAPSRQGFIEVNGSSDGVNNFFLKSGASVSKCPPRVGSMSPALQTLPDLITPVQSHNQKSPQQAADPLIESTSGISTPSRDVDLTNTAPIIKNLENMLKAGNQVFHIQVKIPGAGKDGQNKQIQQVIVVNPGEDADKAMSQAVGEITKRLNSEAAEKLAHGISPDKETIIEITRIANPSESYFSRENVQKLKQKENDCEQAKNLVRSGRVVDVQTYKDAPQSARTFHRRKSPPLGRCIRTVSPQPVVRPGPVKPPTIISSQELFKNQFRSTSLPRFPNPVATNRGVHKSPATDMTAAMKLGMSNGIHAHNRTTMVPSSNPRNLTMVFSGSPSSSNPVTTIVHPPGAHVPPPPPPPPPKRTIAILNRSRNCSHHTYIIQPAHSSSQPNGGPHTSLSDTFSSLDSADTNTHDFDDAASEDGSIMNDSLTNIQWLGHMKGDNLQVVNHKDIRLMASERQIEKVNRECGKNKRPPYSYMHLIQMAICSTPDRKMTLKDIYTWIEFKFPYYRYNSNKGWRNSIRHNLSLYDIFVREKSPVEGKAATSVWTLRSDYRSRPFIPTADESSNIPGDELNDSLFACESPSSDSPVFVLPSTPSSDTSRSLATPTPPLLTEKTAVPKRKPVPLLPKPCLTQPQTYALIPIQGGVPVVPSQPILVPANWTANSKYPTLDLNNAKRLKRSASPLTASGAPYRKQIRIAPKLTASNYTPPWTKDSFSQHKSASTTCNNTSNTAVHTNLDSSESHRQMSGLKFVDSGLGHSLSSDVSGQELSGLETSMGLTGGRLDGRKTGLPRPQLYVEKSKAGENSYSDTSDNIVMLNDSNLSESGINDILASIEKDLCSPAKQLLRTPTKSNNSLLTSTPLKCGLGSPSWISPIKSFMGSDAGVISGHPALFSPSGVSGGNKTSTPLETDSVSCNKQPGTPDMKHDGIAALYRTSPGTHSSCRITPKRSPKLGSLRALGLVGLTPLKSSDNGQSPTPSVSEANQSFGKLLGELHLDSMIEEGINLDVSNISFSHIKCDF